MIPGNSRCARRTLRLSPDVGPHPVNNIRGAHRPRLARNLPAAPENNHGWYRPNGILRSNRLFGLGVQLCHAYSGPQFSGRLFKCGCHHLAWPAPRRPEIYNNRDIIPADMFGKIIGPQFQRPGCKQLLSAFPAARHLVQAQRRDPVNGCAVGTNYMQGITQTFYLKGVSTLFLLPNFIFQKKGVEKGY